MELAVVNGVMKSTDGTRTSKAHMRDAKKTAARAAKLTGLGACVALTAFCAPAAAEMLDVAPALAEMGLTHQLVASATSATVDTMKSCTSQSVARAEKVKKPAKKAIAHKGKKESMK